MKYYKVVVAKDKKLKSWFAHCFKMGVRYERGKWAYPKKEYGPLFVTNDLARAKQLAWFGFWPNRVYECQIGKIMPNDGAYSLVAKEDLMTDKVKITKRVL